MADYLLHSLSEFDPVIDALLEATAPVSRVVEIGVESGCTSALLLNKLAPAGGELVSIDPSVDRDAEPKVPGRHRVIREPSVRALADLERADVYLIDGDHNYFTVAAELDLIDRVAADEFPLVLLHDVRWPWGRRDLYYAPEAIPPGERHAPVYRGVVRGYAGTVAGGFNGCGAFAVASFEGGPGNGVQTAIDDFLVHRPHLRYRVVPVVFGLGVLFDGRAAFADRVEACLAPYHENPLLARLEDNRLDLYLRVLELQELLAARS